MRIAALSIGALLLLLAFSPRPANALVDEGWTVTSFDATYAISVDGTVDTVEDIGVDFGDQQHHGIFRDIPVEYAYDDDNNRLIRLTGIRVDDGNVPQQIEVSDNGANLRIRIGDPDVLVTGPQRYRIQYTINRGLNPFADHDEFYWNVTGNDWPVRILNSSALVTVPGPGIQRVACFQGAAGSPYACASSSSDAASAQAANGPLGEAEGLTVVVSLDKDLVTVEPPELVDANETPVEQVQHFLGVHPWTAAATFILGIVLIAAVIRQWWIAGRDRWYGDMSHASGAPVESRRPLFAHETIVTQFTPPDVDGSTPGRRLRPAEIGLLVDERADTLDVTATIVDLAVRKHLIIKETETGGILGMFKKNDYELERVSADASGLLDYERTLLEALFESGSPVKLSDLENKFAGDLEEVKERLVQDVTRDLQLFPRSPERTKVMYLLAGGLVAGIGGALMLVLGTVGAAILALPVVLAGILLMTFAPSMPRRTANGRELFRRSLGFRTYISRAETERQKFAERANLFEEYLPYAIVFECVDKWARAFEGLGDQATQPGWYQGRGPFLAAAFASSVSDFSESISSVMASTPGGSGGSGFGGGGFSGGGGGGGGGGAW